MLKFLINQVLTLKGDFCFCLGASTGHLFDAAAFRGNEKHRTGEVAAAVAAHVLRKKLLKMPNFYGS
jgi:hypothetical protein